MKEVELFELLQALNYCGRVANAQLLSGALISGPPNILFYDIVTWLGSQLGSLLKLENRLTVDADYLNSSSMGSTLTEPLGFMVEMSSLLKELRCPIKQLTSGSIEERLFDVENKVRVIEYLMQELLSAKVITSKRPQEEPSLKIELVESKTAKALKEMLVSLSFSKPPDDITSQRLFREVEKRVTSLSQPLLPNEVIAELMFSGALTEKQWFQLDRLYADFHAEYSNRRNLELKRTELTIQSFLWGDRCKHMAEKITNRYNERRKEILTDPGVNLSDVLSTTTDINVNEKTSSGLVRKNTQSAVNKVRIGSVPDRGGRPSEQQPPPPEVPSWQKNDSSSSARGGYRQQPQNAGRQFSEQRSNGGFGQGGGERPHFQQRSGNMAPPRQHIPAGDNFAAYGNPAMGEPNAYYGGQHRPNNRRGRGGRGGPGGRGGGGYGGRGGGGFGGHGGHGFGGFGGQGQYVGQGY